MAARLREVWQHVTPTRGSHFIRKFSSVGTSDLKSDKPHIVRQISCYNETQLKAKKWMQSEEFAEKKRFFYEVVPGGLIRPCDVAVGPKLMLQFIGTKSLRQLISLVALNMMNGRNVSHLLTRENVLFSEEGDILLRNTSLPGKEELEGAENIHAAFKALHDIYFGETKTSGLLARSANRVLHDSDLSMDLLDLKTNLLDSSSIDKRLITNHWAQMFPEERDQFILLANLFLRNEAASAPPRDSRRSFAGKIFIALGRLVPEGLFDIHPLIDQWLIHGRKVGHLFSLVDDVEAASSPQPSSSNFLHGKLLVAVLRTSRLHPFGPFNARCLAVEKIWKELKEEHAKQNLLYPLDRWSAQYKLEQEFREKLQEEGTRMYLDSIVPMSGEYTFQQVQQLTDYKIPMFGPIAHAHFLMHGLDEKIDVNQSTKPDYLRWTDIIMPSRRQIGKMPSYCPHQGIV